MPEMYKHLNDKFIRDEVRITTIRCVDRNNDGQVCIS